MKWILASLASLTVMSIVGYAEKPVYRTLYDFYLLGSDSKGLQFKDDKFEFSFNLEPNGIEFTINNISANAAFLEWDRCYFIEPSGDSSKALNFDLIEAGSKKISNDSGESILPANERFIKFTAPVKMISFFEGENSRQLFASYVKRKGVVIDTPKMIEDVIRFREIGRYLPGFKPVFDSTVGDTNSFTLNGFNQPSLSEIKNFVHTSNKTGLNLCLKSNGAILKYVFDFRFKWVAIVRVIPVGKGMVKIHGYKCMGEYNDWIWQKIDDR